MFVSGEGGAGHPHLYTSESWRKSRKQLMAERMLRCSLTLSMADGNGGEDGHNDGQCGSAPSESNAH